MRYSLCTARITCKWMFNVIQQHINIRWGGKILLFFRRLAVCSVRESPTSLCFPVALQQRKTAYNLILVSGLRFSRPYLNLRNITTTTVRAVIYRRRHRMFTKHCTGCRRATAPGLFPARSVAYTLHLHINYYTLPHAVCTIDILNTACFNNETKRLVDSDSNWMSNL